MAQYTVKFSVLCNFQQHCIINFVFFKLTDETEDEEDDEEKRAGR